MVNPKVIQIVWMIAALMAAITKLILSGASPADLLTLATGLTAGLTVKRYGDVSPKDLLQGVPTWALELVNQLQQQADERAKELANRGK